MFDLETADWRLRSVAYWFGTASAALLGLGMFLPWVEGRNKSLSVTQLAAMSDQVTTGGIPIVILQAIGLVAVVALGASLARPEISGLGLLLLAGGALNNTTVLLDVAKAQAERLSLAPSIAVDLFPWGMYAVIATAALVTVQALVVRIAIFKESRQPAEVAVEASQA